MIDFHQFSDDASDDDRLLMFAAPAKELDGWVGIPRKGWRVRMLYQRWIAESRKQEVTAFWEQASTPRTDQPKKYLVGPTAITVALFGEPQVEGGQISLQYERPFHSSDDLDTQLSKCAAVVVDRMSGRLDEAELEAFAAFLANPEADFGHNYVLESLCQIGWLANDPAAFLAANLDLGEDEKVDLLQSLEQLCRPGLVVDGQHRLYGAAHATNEVILPVVAIPNSPWMEQIYQFVIINEKAQKVDSSLLTDIFGSSLTPGEQAAIRGQLDRTGARVEERIAAVIAARDTASPFYGLVRVRLEGMESAGGYIPDATIRQLIEGGRGGRAWRSDDEFYDKFVRPTFADRVAWDSWTDGHWRQYWFAFWDEVRRHYNAKSRSGPLWHAEQTNLTKAVTLRLFQRLFIEEALRRVDDVYRMRPGLVRALGEQLADDELARQAGEVVLPADLDDFRQMVREWFLETGVPVRLFENAWVSSLDDSTGQDYLYSELREAFQKVQDGERYTARNKNVFEVTDS
ncbi:hypothetical protein BJ986_002247 [Phycicoccus badiiscoriae]|uniref:DGQHR domain-containing protein n=1 Tax=Pedococcus badiiscoriae TaxID=642776 RepID=A0A852WG45_9MICO|nr:hypothetical protein [Pedococcus badiiscoriae]NYG07760.1 hypothetical protein [Pedococcus badiiscoriae]